MIWYCVHNHYYYLYKRSWMLVCSSHAVICAWWILLTLLEKVVNITNVHEHNDVTVSIKVQKFRSRFPRGIYGYTVRHYSGRFATNLEYLFFAQFIIEQKKVSEVNGQSVTASQLRANPHRLVNLICQDQVLFQRQIPGTPPHWKKLKLKKCAFQHYLVLICDGLNCFRYEQE